MSGATTAPVSPNPKVSKFAAKSGFVIPKNKLSGSLVPLFRAKKLGSNDVVKEDSAKGMQRKTRWGPDLTQDASVRKGRALAYQTRVDQITRKLKSGSFGVENSEYLSSTDNELEHKTPCHEVKMEKLEDLELERREAIGEILKLNPTYKAPSDYKPLLKDARVPIPVKEYPGYNFIGMIFGPGSGTHKRFEKETGAKIQVYGVKAESREKVEILPSDGSEVQSVYDELYVQISADTFEKVDSAASLIELLVTSVSGNFTAIPTSTSSVADVNITSQAEAASSTPAVCNVGSDSSAQPLGGLQNAPQGQFQYPVNWFQGVRPQTSLPPSSGLGPPPTLSQHVNTTMLPSNPSNMPSLLGQLPTSTSYIPSPTNHAGFTAPPSSSQMSALQPLSAQPNVVSYAGGQGPMAVRASTSLLSQTSASLLPRPIHNQQLTPLGSSGWARAHTGPPIASSQGSQHMGQYPSSAGNMVSSRPFLSQHPIQHISSSAMNYPTSTPTPYGSMPVQPGLPAAPSTPILSSALQHQHSGISSSMSGNSMSCGPPRLPPNTTGNFTFQPHLIPTPGPQRVTCQLGPHNPPPTQASISQPPAFRPAVLNSAPPVMHGTRPQVCQMVQPQFQVEAVRRFGNHASEFISPRTPTDPNAGIVAARASVPHMGPRNFGPAPQMPNLAGAFTPRPPNPHQQNFRAFNTRPENLHSANQQFGMKPSPQRQIYDPFSPTSVAAQQQGSGMGNTRRQETDPEYEDLMASVGVK